MLKISLRKHNFNTESLRSLGDDQMLALCSGMGRDPSHCFKVLSSPLCFMLWAEPSRFVGQFAHIDVDDVSGFSRVEKNKSCDS